MLTPYVRAYSLLKAGDFIGRIRGPLCSADTRNWSAVGSIGFLIESNSSTQSHHVRPAVYAIRTLVAIPGLLLTLVLLVFGLIRITADSLSEVWNDIGLHKLVSRQ